jgi:SAM-dependent methyltransferase
MSINECAGGMNDQGGFPVFFTEISDDLGRYDEYTDAARAISQAFPPASYPAALDICCGIGKMSKALHECGYRVTGLDLSAAQLEIARQISPGPHYIRADMATLPAGEFDLLLNVYTSFGYYQSEEEDLSVLPAWFAALKPGGVLIMELADMDRARNRIDTSGLLVRHHNGVQETLTMDWEKRILTVAYEKNNSQWTCLTRLYEKEYLREALLAAGFIDVGIFGSFDLKSKEVDDNLVLIATKGK